MEKKTNIYRCVKNLKQDLKVGCVVRLIGTSSLIELENMADNKHYFISAHSFDECFIHLEMRLKDIRPIAGKLYRCTKQGSNFIRKGDVVESLGFSGGKYIVENLRTGIRGYIENEDFMSDNYKIIHTNTDEIVETPKQITFESVCKEMVETHKAKNHDYGDSFHNLFKELGINYAYGHLREKLERIKSLKDREAKVKSESMIDSLKDLANYAVMTLVELQNNE